MGKPSLAIGTNKDLPLCRSNSTNKMFIRHLSCDTVCVRYMSDSPQKMQRTRDLPVFSAKKSNGSDRINNTAYWWRMNLGWDIVQIVDTECAGVYERLGFKQFKTEHELRDVRIPSLVNKDLIQKHNTF